MFARTRALETIDPTVPQPWATVPAPDGSERRGDHVGAVIRFDVEHTPHDVAERPGREASLVATSVQLGAHGLIADIAERLVAVDPDAIDDTIVKSLRQVADVLHLDRAIVWQQAARKTSAVATHWIEQRQPAAPEPLPMAAVPFITSKLEAGEPTWFTRLDEVLDQAARETFARYGFRSAALVPMVLTGATDGLRGALAFGSTTSAREWTAATIDQLRVVSGVVSQALARKANLQALQQSLGEIDRLRERLPEPEVHDRPGVEVVQASRLRDQLVGKNLHLPPEIPAPLGDRPIVGRSPALAHVLEQLRQVAGTSSTVLLRGETGTGKELLAIHLHELSTRRMHGMVRVNCSAIPSTLLESELFGRERGAFTGALARQIGRFELADHSTIFLDEIGDLPADVQVKLLRVLEERQIERLGNPKGIKVDVRIVAATHRNLEERITNETFREDLFYRLNVFPIQVPPLRERAEDIPLLVWRFVVEFGKSFGKRIDAIPRDNMTALQEYAWPGNIRELRNVVERAMIVATGTTLTIPLTPPSPSGSAGERNVRMADMEREHVRRVLESSHWRVRGSGGAAERLGLRPTTLETRMARLGLIRPRHP